MTYRTESNAGGEANTGSTGKSILEDSYEKYSKLTKTAKDRQAEAYADKLAERQAYYKDHPWRYAFWRALTGDEDMIQKEAGVVSYDRPQTDFLSSQEATAYRDAQKVIAGGADGVGHALTSGLISGIADESSIDERWALHAQASTNEHPIARFAGEVGPLIIFKRKQPATPLTAGEPVSVATGEYLENWRDFLVPAALAFDGARYMGLKLPLPKGYISPLGPCQISMFDEIVSNPEPGQLDFQQADGKVIRFERPFNFLDSRNAGAPHLNLRAPWLKQLELRDRTQIKHFRQYDDRIYRLERIEDLNGHSITLMRDPAGALERAEGTDGLALSFANAANGRRTAITLIGTDGSQLPLARYGYDARGRMTSAECTFGMSVTFVWDPEHDLLLTWHNLTRRSETQFTYDADGRVTHTATNGIWNGDRFRYDPQARETVYLPGGTEALAQRFAYDESDNVTAETDALGHTTAHTYDAAGFETATIDANGHASATTYDIWGNVKSHTDAEGRNTTYGWGPEGQLDIVIDGAGHIRKYEHDERANVLEETDAEGNGTRYERDERGRVVHTTFPDGAVETRSYDAHGRLATLTDARGSVTCYAYDVFGRQTSITDPTGQTTQFIYEAGTGGFATPSAMIRPDGVRVSRSYSADGVLASVTDGEGRTWRYRYGAFDVLQAIEDPKGGRLALSYDGEGRVTGVTNQNGLTYHLIRDAAGRAVAEEDFDGRRTAYVRDPAGRVVETVKPDGVRLVYGYDRTDKLTSIRGYAADDAEKARPLDETHYWYDGRGLLIRASNQAGLIAFARDGNGRIVAETLNGRRIESRLDARGNRIERRIGAGEPGESVVRIGRDPLGALASLTIDDHAPLSFSRDALGRETRRASARGFCLEQGFDPVGQLLRQNAGREGEAGRAYAWDRAGAPTTIDDRLFGPASYRHDANGQVAQATFGTERFGAELTEGFDYDAAKNVVGVSVEGPEAGSGVPAGLGALLQVRSTPGGVVRLGHGPHGERVALTHDACGRVIERRVDRKGFRPRTWRYGWDALDRLVSCVTPEGERWFYRYDPFGRQLTKVRQFSDTERAWVAKRHPSLVSAADREATVLWTWPQAPKGHAAHDPRPPVVGTHFLWDGDVVAEVAPLRLDGSVDWEAATRWHYEPESFVPVARQEPGGTLLYIVTDHLGTPREMMDEAGRLRWAASLTTWGVVRRVIVLPEPANEDERQALYPRAHTRGNLALKADRDAGPDEPSAVYDCPIRFQGQWADAETGLHYNRHRHYDPVVGQYTGTDPIGLEGGERPHAYVYQPTSGNDPLGLSSRLVSGGGLSAHENAGGHLLGRHVGKSDAELAARMSGKKPPSAASTFTDRATAERAASEAIDHNAIVIKNFLSGPDKRLVIKQNYNSPVGRVLQKGQNSPIPGNNATFVFDKDPTLSTGYRIQTGYPKP